MLRLRADWLVPVTAPPIPDGAVLVAAGGRVAAAGPDAAVPRPPGVPELRLRGAALLPGLVNAHTHLELTGLGGRAEEADFVAWIGTIRRLKAERGPEEYLAAARAGIRQGWASGVTTVADTGDSGAVLRALAELGGSGVAYQEVFGPDPGQAGESQAGLRAAVAMLRPVQTERARLGLSPHAPYSVSGALYAAVARLAAEEDLPLAVHVAESAAESALLADGTGGFAAAWERRGITPPAAGVTPVEWLERHGVLGPRTLCIHAVRVGAGDVGRLRAAGAGIAHCPLSNLRHGHGAAPLAALLDAGLRVGVGTDSEASVGPTDLLAEARAARAIAGLDARSALALATTGAAAAIGLAAEVGQLSPGAWADVVAVALPADASAGAVEEAVLASGAAGVIGTWVGGRPVFRQAAPAEA
ncbi:MAG TPA: amidohydrolase family protein [Gemmatimonadales bacterium]|nr:amidohydrolase family protein [Gemmatimonadales bacterium]